MAKINQPPPQPTPMWPWGGPRLVRERLVDRAQLDRARRAGKSGNPKAPALASSELLDFIAPAHSSEELRLPLPTSPEGHDADVETFYDRPHLVTVGERGGDQSKQQLDGAFARVNAPPDRLERMRALLSREGQMLSLVAHVGADMKEILRLMWEAQKDEDL